MKTLLLTTLFLAGCSSAPVPVVRMEKVAVPTPVPCVEPAQIPTSPVSRYDALPDNAPLFKQMQALLVDREQQKPFVAMLQEIARGCSTLK